MNYFIKAARILFAFALIIYGLQQLYFGDFRNVFFSPYQKQLPGSRILAYAFGLYLIATAVFILIEKKGRKAALLLGAVLLVLALCTQLSYELISEPNKLYHLGLWANLFMEVALCGGAFVVAGSFQEEEWTGFYGLLSRLVPYGNLFFLFAITAFGISHFLYAQYLAKTIPPAFHDPFFWMYFTGTALMGGGIAIILGIRIRIIALLLSCMFFLWFWIMHLPGALSQPFVNRGSFLSGAADDLAFTGITLLIALTMPAQEWITHLENWGSSQIQNNRILRRTNEKNLHY
jgi:uncharacterized membrane protein YphA (DoxX/SURF4 family)